MAVPEFYSGKILYPAIVVLIVLSALFGLTILPRFSANATLRGKPAPDFTLPVIANGDPGARMRLEDLKGKPVLLDFWASWCGPCEREAPVLDRLFRKHKDKGFVVLGIDVDDSTEAAKAFVAKKGLSYPVVSDDAKQASVAYGIERLPTMVIVDREGKVAAYLTGMVDEQSLDEILKTLF